MVDSGPPQELLCPTYRVDLVMSERGHQRRRKGVLSELFD
jgi:hypothetical protein